MVCSHGQGEEWGLSQCKYFADNGGGVTNFCNFVRTSFMDGPYPIKYIYYTVTQQSKVPFSLHYQFQTLQQLLSCS